MTVSLVAMGVCGGSHGTGAAGRDGVHPNAAGSQKIAARWFDALPPLVSP